MKKCLGIVAVLLLVSGAVQAATTLTNTVNSGSRFGQVVLFDTLSPADVWTWSHTGILPTDGDWNATPTGSFPDIVETITSATLEIKYDYVAGSDAITIKADGSTLGQLPVQSDNSVIAYKTFNVNPALFTSDGTLNMSVSTPIYAGSNARLYYSKLVVQYEEQEVLPEPPDPPDPPQPPTPTVPAPGAVVLGALGLGLVSWLRSRKAL